MKNRGLLKMVIMIVIAILILSYFGFSLKDIVESPTSQSNFSYVGNFLSYIWKTFLVTPVSFIWNTIVVGIFWNHVFIPTIQLLQKAAQN